MPSSSWITGSQVPSVFFLVTKGSIPITGGAAEKADGIACEGAVWYLNFCRILLVLDTFCLVKAYSIQSKILGNSIYTALENEASEASNTLLLEDTIYVRANASLSLILSCYRVALITI